MLAEVVVIVLLLCPKTTVARTGRMMYERMMAMLLWSEGLDGKSEGLVEKFVLQVKESGGGLKEVYLYLFFPIMRYLISLVSPYEIRSRIHYMQPMIPCRLELVDFIIVRLPTSIGVRRHFQDLQTGWPPEMEYSPRQGFGPFGSTLQ